MPQFAGALGEGSQHRVAVRDGFVAWRSDSAGQVFCWLNRLFFHATILARHFPGGTNRKTPNIRRASNLEATGAHEVRRIRAF